MGHQLECIVSTVPDSELRSDLKRMALSVAGLKAEASTVISPTTLEQWDWSPDRNTWSMALVLEHLNSVARLGLPAIERGLAQLRSDGVQSDAPPRYSIGERLYIRLLSPNPPFRVPVPPIFVPERRADPAVETGPEFLRGLERTERCIHSANGLDLTRLKIPSPANSRLRLTVGAWLEGLVAHNEYHWMQVRALRSHARFPRV